MQHDTTGNGHDTEPECARVAERHSPRAASDVAFSRLTVTESGDAGVLTVLKAGGDSEEELSVTELKAECMGTPAISGGAVFVQTDKKLLCFKKG